MAKSTETRNEVDTLIWILEAPTKPAAEHTQGHLYFIFIRIELTSLSIPKAPT